MERVLSEADPFSDDLGGLIPLLWAGMACKPNGMAYARKACYTEFDSQTGLFGSKAFVAMQ